MVASSGIDNDRDRDSEPETERLSGNDRDKDSEPETERFSGNDMDMSAGSRKTIDNDASACSIFIDKESDRPVA